MDVTGEEIGAIVVYQQQHHLVLRLVSDVYQSINQAVLSKLTIEDIGA